MSNLRFPTFLLFGIGQTQEKFPSACLPTYGMTFQSFFHKIKVSKRNVKESFAMVAEELINLWRRENLPTKEKQHVVTKIKNEIYKELIRVKKNVKRRDTKQMQKEQTMHGKLNKLFDIAPANA